MDAIAQGLVSVQQRMKNACSRTRREPSSVRLVAVSKRLPSSAVQTAYAAGHRDFGENYPQEMRDKARELEALGDLRWHAIGPVQLNKAKYVSQHAAVFHALDSLALAQALSQRRQGPSLECFLQVNVSGEASKRGVSPEDAPRLCEEVRGLPGLHLTGLMTLPPLVDHPDDARPYFRQLAQLAKALGLQELSMGTTADFEVAVEEGATWIRVGTAIFGERPT